MNFILKTCNDFAMIMEYFVEYDFAFVDRKIKNRIMKRFWAKKRQPIISWKINIVLLDFG